MEKYSKLILQQCNNFYGHKNCKQYCSRLLNTCCFFCENINECNYDCDGIYYLEQALLLNKDTKISNPKFYHEEKVVTRDGFLGIIISSFMEGSIIRLHDELKYIKNENIVSQDLLKCFNSEPSLFAKL